MMVVQLGSDTPKNKPIFSAPTVLTPKFQDSTCQNLKMSLHRDSEKIQRKIWEEIGCQTSKEFPSYLALIAVLQSRSAAIPDISDTPSQHQEIGLIQKNCRFTLKSPYITIVHIPSGYDML